MRRLDPSNFKFSFSFGLALTKPAFYWFFTWVVLEVGAAPVGIRRVQPIRADLQDGRNQLLDADDDLLLAQQHHFAAELG